MVVANCLLLMVDFGQNGLKKPFALSLSTRRAGEAQRLFFNL